MPLPLNDKAVPKKETRINDEIKALQILLIDEHGEKVGIVSRQEALSRAQTAEKDLVEIAPNGNPPVCRLMDFSKFEYEQKKTAKLNKQKQKKVVMKELTFRPNTDVHDVEIKAKKAIAFLEEGYKVRITIRYRGRELSHQEIGAQLMVRIKIEIEAFGQVEQEPRFEGRQMVMLLGPKKKEQPRK